ncbi:30S ribosomal protein S2 [bacterium]|nr:MAG: 30S ribosomal protein S2 [bacterium]
MKTTIKTKDKNEKKNQDKIDALLKLGIQFGHKKSRCHPSMMPYIYGKRNDMYIIDIEKSQEKLQEALKFIQSLIKDDKKIVFVGTKPNVKKYLEKIAKENNLFYIINRWIGGTLTNFNTIKKRLDYYKELEIKEKSDDFKKLSKKERRQITKEIEKLDKSWAGLKEMTKLPDALFLLDVPNNYLAIKEAKNKGLHTIGICDTDANISQIDYLIPANDDALPAIKYIMGEVVEAINKAKN